MMAQKLLRTLQTLTLFCALALLPAPAFAAPRIPADAFAALPTFSNIAISADGGMIAFGAPRDDGNLDVIVYTIATQTPRSIPLGSYKLRRIQFEDGGKLLVTLSAAYGGFGPKIEFSRLFAIDLSTGAIRTLFTQGSESRSYNSSVALKGLLPNNPDLVSISAYDQRSGYDPTYNLYQVSLNSPTVRLMSLGSPYTYQWQTDRDGNPVARADLDLRAKISTLWLKGRGAEWRKVLQIDNTTVEGISLLGLTTSGSVLFRRYRENNFGEIEAVDPTTDRISVVVKATDVELSSTIVDDFSQKILGVRIGGLSPDVRWTQTDLAQAQALLEGQFPGKIVSILDFTPDYKFVVASVETTSEPPKYYLLDVAKPFLMSLGAARSGLSSQTMGQVRATTFKSRDGVDIPVYVTTPPGHNDAKNAPTVIFPHGGPASRDEPRFDWWAQFMASRGYVVIQPQFRGSTGFGDAFEAAGYRQWGKRMQDDVSDAVAWAVKEGMTDRARTCIVGASYGGYAALAGATMTPDLYKCAVAVAGVSDLPTMMREERNDAGGERSSTVNYWAGHIGADDTPAMEAASPRRLVANARAPILLIHGRDDSVVKFAQSKEMADALRRANKPYKLVELRGEDHWLSRAATRLQMLRELEIFLAENLGPGLD